MKKTTQLCRNESASTKTYLKTNQLDAASDILVDQIRAIDNKRLIKKLSTLTKEQIVTLKNNIRVVLDL